MSIWRKLGTGWAIAATAVALPAETQKTMPATLAQWLGDKPGGVAAAYVDVHGVTFANAGKFSAGDKRPITSDTEFEIGSVTKVFTALLLADSVNARKVKLADKVGAPFAASEITYEQLATHSSGLPRLPKDFVAAVPQNPYAELNLTALVKSFEAEARTARPTPTANYSNLGFAVLGQAVAGAWGEPYEKVLKERVLRPLGLNDTATVWRDVDAGRLAPGHGEQGAAAAHWDLNAYAPAGALVSTTRDLAKFLQACLGFVETPMAPALAETMRPHGAGDTAARRIGLAWMLEQEGGTTTMVWHNGGTGGFRSVVVFDPAKKAGVVVLTNHTVGVEALAKALLEGKELPAVAAAAPAAESLREYLGNYPLSAAFVMAITAEGEALFLRATNQPRLNLRRTAADQYAVEGVEASVSFERGADGKVAAMVLHQNGQNPRAPHLPPGVRPAAPVTPEEVVLTPAELDDYAGRYQLGGATFTVKREGGRLLVQLTGQPFSPVFASAKDEFFYKVVDAQLSFVRGADGKVTALVLHQNGMNPRAERVAE